MNARFTILIFLGVSYCLNGQITTQKHLPVFFFKENSTVFDTLYSHRSNIENNIKDTFDIVNIIASYAKENSKYYLVIVGHEDFSESLKRKNFSLARAKKVKAILIKKGVLDSHIIVRAKGSKAPDISKKLISQAKTDNEKEALRRYNRKVDFLLEETK